MLEYSIKGQKECNCTIIYTSMKIFLSYGHDSNAPLIEKRKEYLSKNTIPRALSHKPNCPVA